jgi:hypothetical protein
LSRVAGADKITASPARNRGAKGFKGFYVMTQLREFGSLLKASVGLM